MAYRELGVIEIREVLRRFCLGEGVRAIARGTGCDRKTVGKYVALALAAGLRREAAPTDDQVAAVMAALGAAPGGRPAAVPDRLAGHREQIAAWLADGLRLTKIHRRLGEQGLTVPYSSLHRFAQAHLGFGTPTITVRVAEPPPGEAAEVDFGLLGLWLDPATQQRRRVYGLLVTLCFSRYAFLAIALRQDLVAVLDGLEAAWTFFGGVVRRLVADNLKPVVTRPDRYTPHVNRVFLEYAQYRGFVVDPAVPAHARALAEERLRLLPLPEHPFACDLVRPVVSGKTPYIRFDHNDYSIPPTLIRRPLTLVASDTLVRVLDGTVEVARHPRSWAQGQRVEVAAHLAALTAAKRRARDLRGRDRLSQASPRPPASSTPSRAGSARWRPRPRRCCACSSSTGPLPSTPPWPPPSPAAPSAPPPSLTCSTRPPAPGRRPPARRRPARQPPHPRSARHAARPRALRCLARAAARGAGGRP